MALSSRQKVVATALGRLAYAYASSAASDVPRASVFLRTFQQAYNTNSRDFLDAVRVIGMTTGIPSNQLVVGRWGNDTRTAMYAALVISLGEFGVPASVAQTIMTKFPTTDTVGTWFSQTAYPTLSTSYIAAELLLGEYILLTQSTSLGALESTISRRVSQEINSYPPSASAGTPVSPSTGPSTTTTYSPSGDNMPSTSTSVTTLPETTITGQTGGWLSPWVIVGVGAGLLAAVGLYYAMKKGKK